MSSSAMMVLAKVTFSWLHEAMASSAALARRMVLETVRVISAGVLSHSGTVMTDLNRRADFWKAARLPDEARKVREDLSPASPAVFLAGPGVPQAARKQTGISRRNTRIVCRNVAAKTAAGQARY